MKLYVFTSQPLDIARSALSAAATGSEKFMIPVAFFLIKHPKGNILFDTGDNDKVITDPIYWGPSASLLDKGVKADLAIDFRPRPRSFQSAQTVAGILRISLPALFVSDPGGSLSGSVAFRRTFWLRHRRLRLDAAASLIRSPFALG